MCLHNTTIPVDSERPSTNIVDYTRYNNYPITNSGYIPDDGYIMNNYDDLLLKELDCISTDKILDNTQIDTIELYSSLAILFSQKSPDHKFDKPYLDFMTFCLSMIIDPSIDANFFNIALSEPPFDY